MKTIKDAIQAGSIEQRRRILNNIGIDKDSKNFIVSDKASQASGGESSSTGYVKFYRIKDYAAVKAVLAEFNLNVRYYESHFEKTIPKYAIFNMVSNYLASKDIIPDALVWLTYATEYADDDYLPVMKNLPSLLENLAGMDSSCIEEITEEEYYRPLIELKNKQEY